MDRRAGERERFQSSVDGKLQLGGGGGVSLQATSSRRTVGSVQAVTFCFYSPPSVHPQTVCCYTQMHEMIFYAVPGGIHAVYLACIYPACNTHTKKKTEHNRRNNVYTNEERQTKTSLLKHKQAP